MSKKIPGWVEQALSEFEGTQPREDEEWYKDEPGRWSTIVAIHYPPIAHVYYVVDVLNPEHPDAVNGWYELPGTHLLEDFANNSARKKAYHEQIPHRVRKVVHDV